MESYKIKNNDLEFDRPITIVGPPAAGKTTVGKILADILGILWVDTDIVMAHEAGFTIEEFYQEMCHSYSDIEGYYILKRCLNDGEIKVISTGAGISHQPESLALLKKTTSFYLSPTTEVLKRNYKSDSKRLTRHDEPCDAYIEELENETEDYTKNMLDDMYGFASFKISIELDEKPKQVANRIVEILTT